MDPFSLTVGIIGILGVGGQLAVSLRKIQSLKGAPDELRALNGEMSDLFLIVEQLNGLCRQCNENSNMPQEANLHHLLARMKEKLLELEMLVAFRLTKPGSTASEIQIDRSRWLRLKGNVQRIREDLRSITLSLSIILSAMIVSSMQQFEAQALENHSPDSGQGSCRHLYPSYEVATLESRQHLAKTIIATVRRGEKRRARAVRDAQLAPSRNESYKNDNQIISLTCALPKPVHSLALAPRPTAHMLRTLDMSHPSCALLCTCFCHVTRIIRSPRWLESFFGALFFASVGLYAISQDTRHNIRRSRSNSYARLSYTFPRWLTEHMLSVVFTYAQQQAPELCLRVLRIRSFKEAIFMHAGDGETDKIKEIIAKGQGSVLDFTEVGWSALHYAVVRQQIDTVKYLLSVGADVALENSWGETIYDVLCLLMFGNLDSMQTVHEICSMFNACDIAKSQDFSTLHEIVVGLRQSSLVNELESSPYGLIDKVDRTGKTPLAWAARRGDFQKVEQLLQYQANPRIIDRTGRSPLHYSILANDRRSLLALLKAKSDVRQKTYNSAYTPLRSAIWWGDNVSSVELLLEFGSDVNAQEGDGMAALHEATYRGRVQVCTFLLEYPSTNIDARSESGLTALMIAINRKNHGCLRVLLAHGADHQLKGKNDCNILHLAAKSRDLPTVNILKRYALRDLDIAACDSEGKTALALAEAQRDADPQWFAAFRQLLENLAATTASNHVMRSGNGDQIEDCERSEIWEDARESIVCNEAL